MRGLQSTSQARGIEVHDDRRDMKRVLLVFLGCVLAICLFAFLGMVFSPRLRLAAVAGLGIVVILALAWMLVICRPQAATRPRTVPRHTSPGAADRDETTSLRNQPTWRDDANARRRRRPPAGDVAGAALCSEC